MSSTKFTATPDNLPGKIETRVFIGGSYDLSPVLRLLTKFVASLKLTPIFMGDLSIHKDKIHEYSMRILYQCGRAIFDVTISGRGGHLMEIQKIATEPFIKTLLVYMAYDKTGRQPEGLTTLISTMRLPSYDGRLPFALQSYTTFEELNRIVREFISRTRK